MKGLILDEKEIVLQYERLKNVNKVAELFNISVSTVQRRLKKNGIIFTSKYHTLNEVEVLERYSSLKNIHKVAEYFNMSISPIKKILKINGIDLTNRRYDVNHKYFEKIDNEEKAYWLGFLYADGYIRERKFGNSLELKLSVKDNDHLELFRRCLNSNHKIVYGFSKTHNNGKPSISHMGHLAMYSNELVDNIKSHGFHSRKTFTISKPNLSSDLMNHFIRGYFDGDGSFSFNSKTKTNKSQIVSASEDFQKFIISELALNGIKINLYSEIKLQIQNKVENLKFYHYIYNNAKIYLNRKKEKYEEFRRFFGYCD
jgi:predicted HTH domain antitoxin